MDIVNKSIVVGGMGDYEIPLKNAMRWMWKEHMFVKGCLFHYSQALNSNISQKGLKSDYQSTGKQFNFMLFCYFRQFHALALLPPQLVPKSWNIIAPRYKTQTPSSSHPACVAFITYHRNFWMKNGSFIKEWNCYRSPIRTNNLLECRNAIVNKRFGPHPGLFDFVQGLSDWFCDGFIECEQFIKHGMVNKRHKKEILKNKVLNKWGSFIDTSQTIDDILLFLKETSKAMKANEDTLHEMLK